MTSTATASHQPPVGIDLGTTYSVVAYLDAGGRPTTIPNSSGELITPSAILVDQEDIVVGREAVKSSAMEPENYAECFKRDIGGVRFHAAINGVEVPPEVLSAFVLLRLKHDAERQLGPIHQAVITVPAFFDEGRRRATQDAGRLAGLEVLDIINEPTAAAVAYGYHQGFFNLQSPQATADTNRVLVYDLGGGTFDVTILDIQGTEFRAIATDGDVRLGGKDFDERLVNYLADQFAAAHGIDPRSDPQDGAQLWLDALEAKHALSERSKTTVVCFHAGLRARIEVTRQLLEELTRDLLQRTETTTSLVLRQAGLDWPQIDRVLLVGGSSRMPMVSEMLRGLTGKEPDRSQSPDEVVAHGAALYAGMLMGRAEAAGMSQCRLVNVNSHSLGVVGVNRRTRQKANVILIPKNSPLPCRAKRAFRTAVADQRSVKVPVVEGESHRPEACIPLGECVVRDLPPGLPAGSRIEVEYRYAANGRISVYARLPSVRQSAQVEIERDQAKDVGDLETWRAKLGGQLVLPRQDSAPAAVSQPVDPGNRAGVLQRLDALYHEIGRAAAAATATRLPTSLEAGRGNVQSALTELQPLELRVKEAEQVQQAAAGSAETIQRAAQLAQAKESFQQARSRVDFAMLVLGRECANAGFFPGGTEKAAQEITQLRGYLGE